MTHEESQESVSESPRGRLRAFLKTAMPVASLVFLAVGIVLWIFQVRAGLTLLEEGRRGVTGGRVEFNAFYAASWIWLSLATFLIVPLCRERPRRAMIANIAIYAVLLASLILRAMSG